ncbi:MAG: VIT1/CCC1 family protein [Oscillospiraceae bacterium]
MAEPRNISAQAMKLVTEMQIGELTEHYIYAALAKRLPEGSNRDTLMRISTDELAHHDVWKSITGKDVKPNKFKIFTMKLISRIMGFTFAAKYMENGEDSAASKYDTLIAEIPEAKKIMEDENAHEKALLDLLDEERLQYVGSMVLGLNDALVEITGTLAGLTFAMQSTRLIALSGLITGIAATLSMASSEFLSARNDGDSDALKSSVYTGLTYLVTVTLLVLPFLLFPDHLYLAALGTMIAIVIFILLFFNYYISVARSEPFKKRFFEMAAISLSVMAISFLIGLLVKQWLGVDI